MYFFVLNLIDIWVADKFCKHEMKQILWTKLQWHEAPRRGAGWWPSRWTGWRWSGTICPGPWQQTSNHTEWHPHRHRSESSLWSLEALSIWELVLWRRLKAVGCRSDPQSREVHLVTWKNITESIWDDKVDWKWEQSFEGMCNVSIKIILTMHLHCKTFKKFENDQLEDVLWIGFCHRVHSEPRYLPQFSWSNQSHHYTIEFANQNISCPLCIIWLLKCKEEGSLWWSFIF